MKRGGYIERRTPLRAREFDAAGKRVYSTLPPSPGPKAKRWGAKRAPKPKENWRRGFLPDWMNEPDAPRYTAFELAWFAFVRTFPCFAARHGGCDGDIVAAHITLSANQKGTGMKVPHKQTVALCQRHHDYWDGRIGLKGNPFAGMSREARYERGATWVAIVVEAARPGDDKDEALALEQLGIGRIVPAADGGWGWLAGDVDERGESAA